MTPTFQVRQGDCIAELRKMPSESVQCVATSPPYWGLRDYGIKPSVWGGYPNCLHLEWSDVAETHSVREEQTTGKTRTTDRFYGDESRRFDGNHQKHTSGQFCACGAWRGALGLEPTPDLYLEHMVEVFRQVRRVLHPSGSIWVNMGDSYLTNAGHNDPSVNIRRGGIGIGDRPADTHRVFRNRPTGGLKNKDLCMLPARLALELQADGWYLRQQIPWLKHNCMPESCADRPTSAVEYIYLFSKSESYYYDREAVRVASAGNRGGGRQRAATMGDGRYLHMRNPKDSDGRTSRHAEFQPSTRARRNSDWFFVSLESYTRDFQGMLTDEDAGPLAMIVNPQPFSLEMCGGCETIYAQREYRQLRMLCKCKATFQPTRETKACPTCGGKEYRRQCVCLSTEWVSHFATFPEHLVAPMILAGTSEYGCCHHCGAPYERILEKQHHGDWHPDPEHKHNAGAVNGTAKWAKEAGREISSAKYTTLPKQAAQRRVNEHVNAALDAGGEHDNPFHAPLTTGWRPTCNHPMFPAEPIPCTVLDPFSGSGRTGLAAYGLGRSYIGLEASPRYVKMSEWQFAQRFLNKVEPTADSSASTRVPELATAAME